MTSIDLLRDEHGLRGFHAHGHAGYDRQGQDIVCAALSALTQATWIGLESVVGVQLTTQSDEESGDMRVVFHDGADTGLWQQAQVLLRTLEETLISLSSAYPGHIQIKQRRWKP